MVMGVIVCHWIQPDDEIPPGKRVSNRQVRRNENNETLNT